MLTSHRRRRRVRAEAQLLRALAHGDEDAPRLILLDDKHLLVEVLDVKEGGRAVGVGARAVAAGETWQRQRQGGQQLREVKAEQSARLDRDLLKREADARR